MSGEETLFPIKIDFIIGRKTTQFQEEESHIFADKENNYFYFCILPSKIENYIFSNAHIFLLC